MFINSLKTKTLFITNSEDLDLWVSNFFVKWEKKHHCRSTPNKHLIFI